jgi:leader peptidase (prepilin peptidase) / N-methyltransferase
MTAPEISPLLGRVYFAAFGLCVGSFLNVCISRWPAGLSVVSPRSRCPNCERPIGVLENIPVLSWIFLRARCRGCGLPISVQYPAVELLLGIVWFLCAYHFGFSFTALRVAVFASFLIGIAITDLKHYVIPDGFTITGLVWAMASAVAALLLDPAQAFNSPFASPYEALIGACVGAGAISIIGWLGEASLKKEAMGFGDVTLMAFVGAVLGSGRTLLTIFLGAALGAVVFILVVLPVTALKKRDSEEPAKMPLVPFGVFLAPAAFIALIWGSRLIAWYQQITGL